MRACAAVPESEHIQQLKERRNVLRQKLIDPNYVAELEVKSESVETSLTQGSLAVGSEEHALGEPPDLQNTTAGTLPAVVHNS